MTDTEKQPGLPAGWCWTKLGNIGLIVTGTTPSKKNEDYYGKEYPFFKPEDLNAGYYVRKSKEHLSSEGIKHGRYLPEKSILVTCIGATIGKTGFNRVGGSSNQQINAIIPYSDLVSELIYFFCRSPTFQKSIKNNASATTLPILNKSKFSSLFIPLPPLPEQHRIVQKIEELLTDLDAGVQALEKAKLQVRTYRQAVLKAAFEGKLSEEWREKNPGSESADTILNRITEIMKEKAQKEGKLKNKNKKPIEVNSQNLPEVPKTWTWTSIEQISSFVTDGDHNPPKRTTDGIPHLTARNIIGYKITEENCTFISVHDFEKVRKRYDPHPGDIIVTCVGTIGRTAIVQDDYVFSADRNLAVIRLIDNEIDPKFVQFYLNNPQAQMYMKNASGSTAQPHLYLKHIRAFPIIFAPFEEQKVIVSEIERRFSVIDQIEKTIDQSLAQAEKLRQSILKKAFEGKLVPQDPEDEPSSVLLEKIRQEKAEIEARKKPAKTKSKAKAKPGNTKKAKQTKQTELV